MVKKLLLLVALMLPTIALAQYGSGSWRVHPFFVSAKVQNIVDTHNKVYYLVSGNLYCYDKTSGTNESLNNSNKLSDVTITGMYYNDKKDYVLLTYDNSNIDIILSDGRVVNMPEIKDVVVPQSKVINHVTFDDGNAYVATAYGFSVIDDVKFAFTENRYYGVSFSSVAHVGEKIVVGYGPNVRALNFTAKREKYTAFPTVNMNRTNPVYMPIDDTHFFCNSNDSLEVVTIGATYTAVTVAKNRAASIQRTPTGFIANFPAAGYYITTDANGGNVVKKSIKGEMLSSSPAGDGTVWAMGPEGMHKLGDSNAVKPDGIGISTTTFWSRYNPGDKKFYLASTTDNAVLISANTGAKTEIWSYDGKQWEDVTPPNVPLWKSGADGYQGNYWLDFVPGTKNQYVCATRASGVLNVIDGKIATRYYYADDSDCNIPLKDKYKSATAIDSAGNLWLVQSYKNLSKLVAVLPKDKLLSAEKVEPSDWITPTVPGIYAGQFGRSFLVVAKNSDIKVFSSGRYQKEIILWDNEGDITKLSPKTKSFTQFKGQEGDAISWNYVMCLYAATNGDIWVGTDIGVFSFNPKEAFTNEDFTVNHMKVMDEDGVSEEYLAAGCQVNCVTEDKFGRKYVGTHTNGLFIVDPECKKVLKHFTTDNSVLQANCIYTVSYNDETNSILVVTMNGVCEYFLDITPSANDYSEVSVFPNPVRPDFTGYVTINQLMDKSNVQIVDDNGKVYMETVTDGGICTWNCCDENGERVPTGTYTVMAAQAGKELQPVARFLVVK